ncbi:cyclase family protein [Hydrogenophaga sp.]|uniref:cyclase family protein n=1 Tax=Hydrogenophaga sp. TaxID=1904254 RepID=UPI003D145BF4
MKLIDLTRTLNPMDRERIAHQTSRPDLHAPRIRYLSPDKEGLHEFCRCLKCTPDQLPDHEGWGEEVIDDMSSHCGTHVDAPLHSGTTCEGKRSRTIDEIQLEELYCPGYVLDVRASVVRGEPISVEALESAIDRVGGALLQGAAALIRTGQENDQPGDANYFSYPGMTREGTLYLIERGAKVLGTDAIGWDRPFAVMTRQNQLDGTPLWDGHKAIREREAFIVQKLTNLGSLPLQGFHVGFFPLKLARASAAPARVVAFVSERGGN